MRPTARALLGVTTMAAAAFVATPRARAARLVVEAPPACLDSQALEQEVDDLIGRPLATVGDVDFRLRIAATSPGKWRLRLQTVERGTPDGAVRGTRDIDGKSCAELAEAAAVAVSVAVRTIDAQAPEAQKAAGERVDAGVRAPSTGTPPLPDAPPAPGAMSRSPPPWRAAVDVGLVLDAGALPATSPGLEVEGHLQRSALRLTILGAWFASQDQVGALGAGGTFGLVVGGALACLTPQKGRWTALACVGGELGRLSGAGRGVARPDTGAALWRALRADLGATLGLKDAVAVVLRAGLVVPTTRPAFVFDGSEQVYRPGRFALRLLAGLELGF